MTTIRLQYSRLGERWSIDVVGREDAGITPTEQGDVTIWRDLRGSITSVLVDNPRLDPDVLEFVTSQFGSEVASLMTDVPDDDIDREVDAPDSLGELSLSAPDSASTSPVVIVVDEPGVPSPIGDGRFHVSFEFDMRVVDGVVEHDRVASRMRVEIGTSSEGEPLWVRVADGSSGAVLALAPLRSTGTEGSSSTSEFVFGLSLPTQALHFSVSDDPAGSVGDRVERRRTWARRLEHRANAMWWPRERQARLYEKASEIHTANGDIVEADRCRESARRVRRRRRWFVGGSAVVALAIPAVIGFAVGRNDSGASIPAVAAPELSIVTQPSIEFLPVDAGPVDLIFGDGREAQLLVSGDIRLAPGDELDIVVRTRLSERATFERLVDCQGSEAGNSLTSGDGPMYQPTFVPVLENASDPESGSRAFPPFAVERAVDTYFVLPGQCEANAGPDGIRFDVVATAVFTPHEVTLRLPDDLEEGSWRLNLLLENVEGESSNGNYVTIRVER